MRGRLSVVRGIGVVVAAAFVVSLPAAAADGFDPTSTTVGILAGSSQTIEQTLHLDALPQKADVVIAIDTTGSMGTAIAEAKADATAIVNDIKSRIPGARFAVVDFQDYPLSPYGFGDGPGGGADDVPYRLRRALTSDAALVQAAINGMTLGDGGDLPESSNRVFFETYSDPALLAGYDPGASRILIMLTDAIPHDPEQAMAFDACPSTTAPDGTTDPGRDGLVGTADDIRTNTAIQGLISNNTTLSVITYSTFGADPAAPACLKELAEATGGTQVPRGNTGTLLALIEGLVIADAERIEEITFEVDGLPDEGWSIEFTPPLPYGPFTAPRDIPFEETITVPETADVGDIATITVTAMVDGVERATHVVNVVVSNQAIAGLKLSVDRRSVRAGIASFSPSVVPAARIPIFAGASTASTTSTPVGSIPVGSVPVGSVPVGSVPVGSIPVGSIPVGSVPVGSIPVGSVGLLSLPVGSVPVGSIPVGSVPVGSVPVGSVPVGSVPVGSIALDQILLSSLPLAPTSGTTWAEILAGTDLAGRPLQTVTLHDVAELALSDVGDNVAAVARFNALTLKDVPFFSSLLRNVKLASALLGKATLSQIKPGTAGSWKTLLDSNGGNSTDVDPTRNTVLGLDIAGRLGSTPVGSVPVGSIPFASLPVGSVPVGSIPVGSVDLRNTRLASVPIAELGTKLAAVVNCSASPPNYCTSTRTFGEAQTDRRILATATIADLDPVLDKFGITLAEVIAALLGLDNYPWAQVPLVGLQDVAGTGERARYTAEFDVSCGSGWQSLTSVRLALPPGFVPVAGSARWGFGVATPVAGPEPVKERVAFRWAPPASPTACGTSTSPRHVTFQVDTFAGIELGDFTTDVTATAGATLTEFDEAPILVVQNHEANDLSGTATPLTKNKVFAFHVAAAGDKEVFSLPIPARNTRTAISLNVPDDADLDLVVGRPEAFALNSAPVGSVPVGSVPVGSVPLPDEGATANDALRSPQPDTLQDIPVGSVPVGSVSANRGSADESVQLVSDGTDGAYTVTVSGYNGSKSIKAATMYVSETPPPPLPNCAARTFLNRSSAFGSLPASLPAATKTLFLINRNQMAGLHGETAVQDLLTYIGDQSSMLSLAARDEVKGAVLEVDGTRAVRDAYDAWNAAPCSVEAANAAVRAANDVVGSYLASLPNLKYIVLLGSDEVLPAGRVPDPVLISPELDNASDLAFTTAGLTNGNALYAAAATNHIMSDAVYGAFTTIPWLGRQLNLPQVAVSRLLESPEEIGGQLAQYVAADGELSPTSAYVTGYDFLTDGAEAVRDGLTRANLTPTLQTSPDWTKSTVEADFFNQASVPDIGAINAHYNHFLAQPAKASTAAELFSTSIVPPGTVSHPFPMARRVLFTMGCHGGLNVADTLLGGTLPPDARDWAQAYARARVAVYIANYTFGYGDTEASALSERLMAEFAVRAGADDRSLAEQWVESLHTYFATAGTAYGVYDEKAMIGANLMGPPWYRVPVPAAPAYDAPDPNLTPTEAGVGDLLEATVSITVTPTTTAVTPSTLDVDESILTTHYRPIQPVLSTLIHTPTGTPAGRGIFITGLATHDEPNVNPDLAMPTIDLGAHEPPTSFDETYFPANYVLLARTGLQTRAVVSAGQFRPTPDSNSGTQRLVDSISFDVAFDDDEGAPPQISHVGAVAKPTGGIRIFVRATDGGSAFRRAAALVNAGASGSWQVVPLVDPDNDGMFVGDAAGTLNAEIIAQVQNVDGYTAYSTKKGENFNPIVNPPQPDLVVDAPRPGAYVLNEVVVPAFSCSSAAGVHSCVSPDTIDGKVDTSTVGHHTYRVISTDLFGVTTTRVIEYDVWFAFDGFKPPIDNQLINVVKAGNTIPLKWQLRDAAGVLQRDLNSVTSFTTTKIACPNSPQDPVPDEGVPEAAGLSYDAVNGQFVFTLPTKREWKGTCRKAYLQLSDTSPPYTAVFLFK